VTSKFNDQVDERDGEAGREEPLAAGSARLLQGRYRVESVLGEREGIVTALAHDRSTAAQVVLRQFTSNSSWDDDQIEARAAAVAQLGSEHAVRLASWFPGKARRGFYFVFEALRGENLGIVLERRGRIEIAAAADYLLQACDAVAEVHAQNLVHGSIRSTSLFLTGEPEREKIKLLDFELLPWGADEGERPTLPPELLQGSPRAVSHSDIWALGVVLYQLVTGELPFASSNGPRSLTAPPFGNPRSIWQLDLSATPSAALRTLQQVIERCLSRHVSDRFTSVMELALRLLPLAPTDSIGQRLWRGRLKRTPMYPERNSRNKKPGSSGIEVRGPFLRTGADNPSEPLIASRLMGGASQLLDGVQLSVFRPRRVQPGLDYRVLAFVHRNRFANAPDPMDEVQRQAEQMLKQASAEEVVAPIGAAHGVPHESTLTFVPLAEGVEFIPPRRMIRWRDGVQHAEFRLRAGPGANGLRRGRMSVYLGALLIGDVPLQLRVSNDAPALGEVERVSAPAYRKVYAACSGLDDLIAGQIEALSDAFADSFLTDLNQLRTSEQWSQRLAEMIREADVFQLFWSDNAMGSAFVRGEWEYALALGRTGDFIRPVYWDMPRPEAPGLPPPNLARFHFQYVGVLDPPLPVAETDQTLRVPRPAELELLALEQRSTVRELAQEGATRARGWAKRPLLSAPRLAMVALLAIGIGLLLWRRLSETPPRMIAFDEPVPVLMLAVDLSRDKAVAAAEELRDRAPREADPAQPPVILFVRGASHGVAIGPFPDLEAAREARRRSTLGSSLVLDLWGECIQYPLFLGTLEGFPTYFCQPPRDPTDE